MNKEIETTVDLWANSLFSAMQDNGDGMGSALATFLKSTKDKPTDEQIDTFKKVLSKELLKLCESNWDPSEPIRCAHFRILSVDYDPCAQLRAACEAAKISTHLLPIKSITWTNPGKVSHRFGYSAQITDIIL